MAETPPTDPPADPPADPSRDAQTDKSREFFLAEYQALQGNMQFVRNDLIRTEAISALAVATILSWVMTNGPAGKFALNGVLLIAFVITVAAGLRAVSRNRAAKTIAIYLRRLETALSDDRSPGGYETFAHITRSGRRSRHFSMLPVSRYLVWIAMLLGTIGLCIRTNLAQP